MLPTHVVRIAQVAAACAAALAAGSVGAAAGAGPQPVAATVSPDAVCARAATPLQLGFPFAGTATASLCIRRGPGSGPIAVLLIDKGQFLCAPEGCRLRLTVDQRKPLVLAAEQPAGAAARALVLRADADFMGAVLNASHLVVQADLLVSGEQEMAFDLSELDRPLPVLQAATLPVRRETASAARQ